MSDRNSVNSIVPSNAAVPTLLIFALSGLSYLTLTSTLETRRPEHAPEFNQLPVPVGAEGFRTTFSRLWQDPLSDVKQPEVVSGKSQADVAEKIEGDVGQAAQGSQLQSTDVNSVAKQIEQRVARLRDRDCRNRILCMPVLVPGGPYVESREQRRRTRYALLSALGDGGYALEYPERMSLVTVPVDVTVGPGSARVNLEVPVKLHYRSSNAAASDVLSLQEEGDRAFLGAKYAAVIVLWINESQLGNQPLAVVQQVIEHFFAGVRKAHEKSQFVDVAILGPSTSDLLLEMAREDRRSKTDPKDCSPLLRYFSESPFLSGVLYSPQATIHAQSLSTAGRNDREALLGFMKSSGSQSGIRVVRTIGDDERLVKILSQELQLRGAWPHRDPWVPLADDQHIVLITERDTLYGQGFRRAFQTEVERVAGDSQRLHHFTFLRGIDGQYPKSDRLEDRPRSGSAGANSSDPDAPVELPHGSGQVDYVRRLVEEIRALRNRLHSEGRGDVRAIGVVGTDVYDKLLVLRALRPHFPVAKFFTTDLDARLAYSQELPFTRNLLVASHFGLKLDHNSLGRTVLPFRDSYQAATYFSVRLAIDHCDRAWRRKFEDLKDPWGLNGSASGLESLMFEIGRNGPYQLTRQQESTALLGMYGLAKSLHPLSPREQGQWASWRWVYKGVVALVVVLLAVMVALLVRWMSLRSELGQNCCPLWVKLGVIGVLVLLVCLLASGAAYQYHHRQLSSASVTRVLLEGLMVFPVALLAFVVAVTFSRFTGAADGDRVESRGAWQAGGGTGFVGDFVVAYIVADSG